MPKIKKVTKRKRNQYGGISYTRTFKNRKSLRKKQKGSGKNHKNRKRQGDELNKCIRQYLTRIKRPKFQGHVRSV